MFCSLFRRPLTLAVSCVLLLIMLLPLTALAKSTNASIPAQSHRPITVTTDASCANQKDWTIVTEVRISNGIPSVTVSGGVHLSTTDPNEHNENQPLEVFDAAGYLPRGNLVITPSGSRNFNFTATKNDTLWACIDGADGDETGYISFQGLLAVPSATWAGYASTGLNAQPITYSLVQGSWKVPKVVQSCLPHDPYTQSAVWVGLSGSPIIGGSKNIAQIGTESNCNTGPDKGVAFGIYYFAVYQMFNYPGDKGPQPIKKACGDNGSNCNVDATMQADDDVEARVSYKDGSFELFIHDITRGWHSNLPLQHPAGSTSPAARYSADWIVEWPGRDNGVLMTSTEQVDFSNCFTEDGLPIDIGPVTDKFMIVADPANPPSTPRVQPSDLRNYGHAFSVSSPG